MTELKFIQKRNKEMVEFDEAKITEAIWKAAKAVGGKSKEVSEELTLKVVEELKKNLREGESPSVEFVQDVVEKALIESGHAKTAKAYILYRQERAKIRKEKQLVLEKEELDEVDKRFDVNALRVLKSRYLKKNEEGKLTETPKELFTRVAIHAALPDLLYDEKVFDLKAKQSHHSVEEFNEKENHLKYSIGRFALNEFHLEALKRMYDRAAKNKTMKVSWNTFLEMLDTGEFDSYEKNIDEFYNVMTEKRFMPNTPAIANFGSFLGMGSACFHPTQVILTETGTKSISEIKVGEKVLTHLGRYRTVTEVFERESNNLFEINCYKLPKTTLKVTEEHPILSLENNKVKWKKVRELNKGDLIATAYPSETYNVEEIKVSDYVKETKINSNNECFYSYEGGKFNAFKHETKTVKNSIKVDFDLMKLFGYYLAEGSVSDNDCVRFTFSADETNFCNDVISVMEKKFGVTARIEQTNNESRKWLSLRFHSTILAKLFSNIFGTGFNKKIVPNWMLLLPVEKQKGLIIGIARGDGTIFKNGNTFNARIVMSNENLVYSVWQICMRLELFCSLGKESMPKLATTQPFRCTIGGEGSELIEEISGNLVQAVKTMTRAKQFEGITFTPIDEIKEVPYNGKVFNLEVEEDHSYVANTIAVHNCFVLGVDDSIDAIMETLKNAAIIFKSGGGLGYNFSKLRPEGDFVSTTSGVASGPLSFMTLFDKMTEVIKQGGIRRGANMGILNSNHPDIEKFVLAKAGNKALTNFNISVLIMPDFWEHYHNGTPYPLRNPRTGEIVKTVDARLLFDRIVYQAWESAEPGVIFFDKVNETNPFYEYLGPIVTTNPCIAEGTLIPTEKGLQAIEEISLEQITIDQRTIQNQNTDGTIEIQKGTKLVKPLQVIKTGVKECFKLEMTSGYHVTATADHKFLTSNGWKELKDLKIGEELLIQSGEGKFNSDNKLPFKVENTFIGENGRTYELNLPQQWSKELGLVLGRLTGDGWLNTKYNQVGLVFSEEDEDARKLIQPIFEEYCNREIKIVNIDQSASQIRSSSKYVTEFFTKLGIKSVETEREVPKKLFTGTEEAVKGFLSGLFSSDGTISLGSKSRNYIRLNSSSLKLLKGVQLLLLNLGIKSTIYDRATEAKTFKYISVKGEDIEYKTSGVNYELNISKENIPKFIQKIEFIQAKNKEKIQELKKFDFYSEKFSDSIVVIESVGKKTVYDITEPFTHSFIANGIVVHNCGEVLLYPNEPCNLGSINVQFFAKEDENGKTFFDWEGLKETVLSCTKFLDNVIDVNNFPLPAIEEMALKTRKIGLGIMGLGDLMYELRIPFNTAEGRKFMEQLMEFVNYYSKVESIELAKTRGSLPLYDQSFYKEGKLPFKGFDSKEDWHFNWNEISEKITTIGIRNGYTTIIAPTGSISMIAGTSSGMEPVYSLVFEKNVKVGSFFYADAVFEKAMKEEGLYDEKLMEEICNNSGSVQTIPYVPQYLKDTFVTAMDITPEEHIRALAAFQKWTDSSISKTNNFPANATVEDMKQSYLLAYKLGCKDVTVFRDSSIKNQVLNAPKKKEEETKPNTLTGTTTITASSTTTTTTKTNKAVIGSSPRYELKNCPECSTSLQFKEGCVTCLGCGWGLCK